ncbi:hypothetical protein J437_LFUL009113 [Ladona fulva]|uniref:snRNA-activating protein complex subunit 3 n=1 Tax=Ladona fulva TaxID=123851 RepID=A0A8K0K668_LADFU|nr:hypothetical protein J437_LFUL009113 [Ladona fulva]
MFLAMDEIYASLDKRWVTEKIPVKKTFAKYAREIDSFLSHSSAVDSMSKILNTSITTEQAAELEEICNHEKFALPSERTYKLSRKATAETGCVELPLTEEGKQKLATLKLRSESRSEYGRKETGAYVLVNKNRSRITTIKAQVTKEKVRDLKPYSNYILTVRIYHPFQQNYGSRKKVGPVLAQIIHVCGGQKLTTLRDTIFCINDYAVPGDRSENLTEIIKLTNKEIYPSGFFFIEDVFYNDRRDPSSKDYSSTVLNWLRRMPGKVDNFRSVSMEDAKFDDLCIRLGYPYVYVHQGSCEHIILFSDASPADSLVSTEYPMIVYMFKKNSILCNFCGHFVAMWMVHACDRIPYRWVHLCKSCLKTYCYKDGKKIGNFYLYEYIDPSSVLHNEKL